MTEEAAPFEAAPALSINSGDLVATGLAYRGAARVLVNMLAEHLLAAESEVARLTTALQAATEAKDGAYLERNGCVALIAGLALANGWKAGTARTAIEGWDPEWHGAVYIDLPAGQVSWHYHSSQEHLFAFLPPYDGSWDGHDTPTKYDRVQLTAIGQSTLEPVEMDRFIEPIVDAVVARLVEDHPAIQRWWEDRAEDERGEIKTALFSVIERPMRGRVR